MAKVLWQGGFDGGPDWGAGDAEILRQAAEKRAERDRAALAYQAAVDQRNLGYGIAAVAALALVALWGSRAYTANKGHRVPRNRHAIIHVEGSSMAIDEATETLEDGGFENFVARRGGRGRHKANVDYKVPMKHASRVMSVLRRKFPKDISKGRIKIKLVREGKWPRGRRIGKGA